MESLAVISMGRPDWSIPAIGIVCVGLFIVVRACRQGDADRGARLTAATFKFVGLGLLAACLVEPVWSDVQPKPHANMFLLLADNSQSLNVKNQRNGESDQHASVSARYSNDTNELDLGLKQTNHVEIASDTIAGDIKRLLGNNQLSWKKRLEQDFDFHQFAFDRRLRHVTNVSGLAWDGDQSSLKSALRNIAQRFQGQPVGGVILLTDGNATDMRVDEVDELVASTIGIPPLYPVVFDHSQHKADIAISSISLSQTAFEDAPVSLQCDVTAFELVDPSQWTVICDLANAVGTLVERKASPIVKKDQPVPFRFQIRPEKLGTSFYTVSCFARRKKEANSEDSPGNAFQPDARPPSNASDGDDAKHRSTITEPREKRVTDDEVPQKLVEATTLNNSRIIKIDRGRRKHRILYLAGRPNWEFKFLRRSVQEDDLVELTAMIRVAKREAKFDFRGRDGQNSNSIFRGFKKDADEETERYDEPVIIRLNTRDPNELRDGFPKDTKKLFEFDAIVLDDIEASFFSQDQLDILARFVSERGGSLLMLGGQECFHSGGYDRTPVGDLLPVYLDRANAPDEDIPLTLDLTREGWLQPWVRLRSNENDEKNRLSEMPGFRTLNPTDGIKPGASVLASISDGTGKHWPALVTQKFGRGRSAAMLVGDLWRWQLNREDEHPEDMAKAWRQMMRWLVADVTHRVELETVARETPNSVLFRVKVHDEEYKPLENARVKILVEGPLDVSRVDQSADHTLQPAPSENPVLNTKTAPKKSEEAEQHTGKQLADVPPNGAEKLKDNSDGNNQNTNQVVLVAEASLTKAGVYEAEFTPQNAGAWRVKATATSPRGDELAADETGWVVESAASEFHSIGTNHALLESLAIATGGEMIHESTLDGFVTGLKSKPMPVMEAWTMPIWNQPYVFLIVVACFVVEWGLRRRRGLP